MCNDGKCIFLCFLISRYSGYDVRLFLLESSCLDPGFKAMPYLSNDEREKVYKSLEEKVMEINSLKTKALEVFDIKLCRITIP